MLWRSLLPGADTPTPDPARPGFGRRVTLRQGDRIVRRDAGGQIEILQVTSERSVETVAESEEAAG